MSMGSFSYVKIGVAFPTESFLVSNEVVEASGKSPPKVISKPLIMRPTSSITVMIASSPVIQVQFSNPGRFGWPV